MRLENLKKKAVLNYLLYALGEIVLVVIGILIAIGIDDANEEKRQATRLNNVFITVQQDIEDDLREIDQVLNFYEEREDTYRQMAQGQMTKADFETCDNCEYLISAHESFSREKRGYDLLKTFNSEFQEDTLVNTAVQLLNSYYDNLDEVDKLITESLTEDLKAWRNQYDWFSEFIMGNGSEAFTSFVVESKEFRNQITWRYLLIYKNFVPVLQRYKGSLQQLNKQLDKRIG